MLTNCTDLGSSSFHRSSLPAGSAARSSMSQLEVILSPSWSRDQQLPCSTSCTALQFMLFQSRICRPLVSETLSAEGWRRSVYSSCLYCLLNICYYYPFLHSLLSVRRARLCRASLSARSTSVQITDSTAVSKYDSVPWFVSQKSRTTEFSTKTDTSAIFRCALIFGLPAEINCMRKTIYEERFSDLHLMATPSNMYLLSVLEISVTTSSIVASYDWEELGLFPVLGMTLDTGKVCRSPWSIHFKLPATITLIS